MTEPRAMARFPRVSVAEARRIQLRLREQLLDRAPAGFGPELVAGAAAYVPPDRETGYAAVAVLDAATLEMVDRATHAGKVPFPYVPGLRAFRELPLIVGAWRRLERAPDAVIFAGHGYAHPCRFGLACHGGLLLDLPSVGCAESLLVGEHGALGPGRRSTAEIRHEGETVGMAVRTRARVRPVYVSAGYRMDLDTAVRLVLSTSPRYRVPEPVRAAHRLARRLSRESMSAGRS